MDFIPVNRPFFTGNEKKYLAECIDTGWVSSEGPFVERFEVEFASYVGRKYGVAVSSGSAALDIAVKALDLSSGDEVIMPTFTIISPAFSVLRCGATIVPIDSEYPSWNMNVDLIKERITSKTKAILIVHTYGLPADVSAVLRLAYDHNLYVIEDAAEVHGQTYDEQKCGSFGDISIFSFYANKHINTGEGGMVLCDDSTLRDRCRKLRNLAFEPDKPRFIHYEIGWNYRMTNLQAAIGVAQLENLTATIYRKREIGAVYQKRLKHFKEKGFQLPLEQNRHASNIYWVFGIVASDEEKKRDLASYLGERKIATRPFFWCMHEQPVFAKYNLAGSFRFPVAEHLARCGIYLPSGTGLTEQEQHFICDKLDERYA